MITEEKNIPDELNDLKSIWKSQSEENTFDKEQIFHMIHRKSVNSVQWLFIITLIELLLAIGLSLSVFLSGHSFMSNHMEEIMSPETQKSYNLISYIGLLGSLCFVGITYYFYRKISSNSSVRKLMENIILFRKSLLGFIVIWIVVSIFFIFPIYYELGEQWYLKENHSTQLSEVELISRAKMIGSIIAISSSALAILFSLIYYGIIYGIFLRRLGKNLKELKKMK